MRVSRSLAVAAACVIAVNACDATDDDPSAGDGREAAVYELILDWMLEDEPAPAEGETEPTVFVASRHETPINVDVQALVVEALDGRAVVRFIDERSEAVDDGADLSPVRDDGVLVGLGAVPPEGDRVDVYVDRYRTVDDVAAWDVTARRAGESWELAGEPVIVDVRPVLEGD